MGRSEVANYICKLTRSIFHITEFFYCGAGITRTDFRCHPYHSWEKGSVENTNKYIRKFIPKGSDISLYGEEEISAVEEKCNGRFMEVLKYATPLEKLEKYYLRIKKQHKSAGGES